MNQIIEKAIEFAKEKHKDQKDDMGNPYFEAHLEPVGKAVSQLTNNPDIIAASVLHDILEDTKTSFEELVMEFGSNIANLVNELTHEGEADEYGFYFPRLKSKEAIMIKLIDRASNISRMENWTKERKEQYLRKTKFWRSGDRNL